MKKIILMMLICCSVPCIEARNHKKKAHSAMKMRLKNMSSYPLTITTLKNGRVSQSIWIQPNVQPVPFYVANHETVRVTAHLKDHYIAQDFNRERDDERVWYIHVYQEPHKSDMSIKIERSNSYW